MIKEDIKNNEYPIIVNHPDNIDLSGEYNITEWGHIDKVTRSYSGEYGQPEYTPVSLMPDKDKPDKQISDVRIQMLYDKNTYDKLLEKSDNESGYKKDIDIIGDMTTWGPRYGRVWDENHIYIEWKGDDGFRHWNEIDDAFKICDKIHPIKLNEEAQRKVTETINYCLNSNKNIEYIVIMDNRNACKIMDLSDEAIQMLRTGQYNNIGEAIFDNMVERAEISDSIDTLHAFINTPNIQDYDIDKIFPCIEHLHDVLCVYDAVQEESFEFLGKQELTQETEDTIGWFDDLIYSALKHDPRLKEGFSMYYDAEGLSSIEELDLAILHMIDFKKLYEENMKNFRYEGKTEYGDQFFAEMPHGLAETASIVQKLSLDIENVGIDLHKHAYPPYVFEQKIQDARKIAEEYIKWFRMEIDQRAEQDCAHYGYDLPWGETGLHVEGLPDTISTKEQRDKIVCDLKNIPYHFGHGYYREKYKTNEPKKLRSSTRDYNER